MTLDELQHITPPRFVHGGRPGIVPRLLEFDEMFRAGICFIEPLTVRRRDDLVEVHVCSEPNLRAIRST